MEGSRDAVNLDCEDFGVKSPCSLFGCLSLSFMLELLWCWCLSALGRTPKASNSRRPLLTRRVSGASVSPRGGASLRCPAGEPTYLHRPSSIASFTFDRFSSISLLLLLLYVHMFDRCSGMCPVLRLLRVAHVTSCFFKPLAYPPFSPAQLARLPLKHYRRRSCLCPEWDPSFLAVPCFTCSWQTFSPICTGS